MLINKLYVYAAKGASLKPGSLVGDCALRADYLSPPELNGDAVGVVHATSAAARQKMESAAGITVLPPIHLQLKPAHVTLFSFCGAQAGDTGYDLGIKLFSKFGMPWMHPENGPH